MTRAHRCGSYLPGSRREWLKRAANGFGAVALASLLAETDGGRLLSAADETARGNANGGAPGNAASGPANREAANREAFAPRPGHFAARAKHVIFLYMDGGPSQVDTFDPKPLLQQQNGKPFAMKIEPTQFNNIGNTLGSPWKFSQHGESGLPISELFPHLSRHADSLAVVRSMTSDFSEHTNGNYFLHTGIGIQGRPSMGVWFGYGLGSECRDLPGFIVLNGGLIPPGGLDNFNSGFLPATYQGSVFNAGDAPVANIRRAEASDKLQLNKLALLNKFLASIKE